MAFWKFQRKEVEESYSYTTEFIEADSMEQATKKNWDTDIEFEYDNGYDDTLYYVIEVDEDGEEIGDYYEEI